MDLRRSSHAVELKKTRITSAVMFLVFRMYAFPVLVIVTEVIMVLFNHSTGLLSFSSCSVFRTCKNFSYIKNDLC
jgi:hypothetical protein